MKKIDLEYVCQTIGNLSGIPVRLYKSGRMILYHSVVDLVRDPLGAYEGEIMRITEAVGYYITPLCYFYGTVNSGEYRIVIGPTSQLAPNEIQLKELAFMLDVSADELDDFIRGMKSINPMPPESVMQMLCILNHVLNGETLSLGDLAIGEQTQEDIRAGLEAEQLKRSWNEGAADKASAIHNTLDFENTLMSIISKGDTSALTELTKSTPALRPGIVARDQLRQIRNTFIIVATLASRAAIRGGLAADSALSLSDLYIQKCELTTDIPEIINLQYRMISDYTERVERLRLGERPSRLAAEVAGYVQRNLSHPITTEEIASALYMGRSRLSTAFKKETGIGLAEFITRIKLEEAKRLLRYSDKSQLAISAYLGFSSQSHFSRAFKKYTGRPPHEYREKKRNS